MDQFRPRQFGFLLLLTITMVSMQCSLPNVESQPDIFIHYLGHSSFLLQFDNGITILTDYGTSRAWGLDSPIYGIGELRPDVVTYSHTAHIDHYGGELPENIAHVLTGDDSLHIQGISIIPIHTSELSLEEKDNTSYLISYKGFRILHLGDAQANIKAVNEKVNRIHLLEIFREPIDLLLMTIGGRTDILEPAEAFVALLQPKRMIPMHYWKKEDKQAFLALLERQSLNSARDYRILELPGAEYTASSSDKQVVPVQVISLEPAPFQISPGESE
jgi:L-ascorbate metabolism protein UlaG (beta-lactamase superfamily)